MTIANDEILTRSVRVNTYVKPLTFTGASEGEKSVRSVEVTANPNSIVQKLLRLLKRRHPQDDQSAAFVKSQLDEEKLKHVPEASNENVIIKYEWLQQNGFPVLPRMRLNKKDKSIHMTYLQGKILDKHLPEEKELNY